MTKTDVFLHSFVSVLPTHSRSQKEITDWILDSHERSSYRPLNLKMLRHFCVGPKQIEQRYFECSDIVKDWGERSIYKIDPESPCGAEIDERNLYYAEKSQRILQEFYPDNNEYPEHLIHVTCTGYTSPGAAQIFFSKRRESPEITHAFHMGCYAALPAIRMAQAISLAHNKIVDIVHIEMCSLHLNSSLHTPEQMVVQSLFSDGNIKYKTSTTAPDKGFKVGKIHELLIPESLNDMTWIPGPFGMEMSLSRDVPAKIGDKLNYFLDQLSSKLGKKKSDLLQKGIFAIHPGGPKIIEAVQRKFNLSHEQVQDAQKVFLKRGNMSSATLPHVWKEIIDRNHTKGTDVVSLAFGPGLTIFGSHFEVV
ncbi:MAG: 3-oxoacyl-[acyl-carrier-protein] synthase III C-terminal domain-containing protein [Bacteriovoracaceae bacterium]